MADCRIFGLNEAYIDNVIVFEAGRQAREEAMSINRSEDVLRLISFRRYLQATVTSMSALIPDALSLIGWDVGAALDSIRPDASWPRSTAVDKPYGAIRGISVPSGTDVGHWRTGDPHIDNYLLPLRMGAGRISDQITDHWAEVVIAGGSIDITFKTPSFDLSTASGLARITFSGRLPAVIVAACSGLPLDQLVSLPLTNGRGYLVTKVTCSGKTSAVEFAAGRLGISMPWR